ncbi:MAG: DNA-processing protein DprA, partial [Elusimicrobiota bacterium]|nr:DNA-processing protein DprA [Elusimicrobiota bacterium]
MQLTELQARILLNMVPDIGPIRANRLVSYFGTAAKVFESYPEEIAAAAEISTNLARKILRSMSEIQIDKELEKIKKSNVEVLITTDEKYPPQLKVLPDPPIVLYLRGKLDKRSSYSIAIVGTRRPTEYGRIIAEKLASELSEFGVTIVSGLARGIDTCTHKATIESGGKTIAVLGNGLCIHYPPENRKLEEEIIKHNGAIISEFPMSCLPEKGNFPRRNRLIAGLSLGTVVIEADEKSGALITSKYAAEQGKEIFAVPGNIFNRNSKGPHMLIKQGAKLV